MTPLCGRRASRNRGMFSKRWEMPFAWRSRRPVAHLRAAIQAQRALAAERWGETGPLTSRMGIHSGTAEYRDDDYFGGTLNRDFADRGCGTWRADSPVPDYLRTLGRRADRGRHVQVARTPSPAKSRPAWIPLSRPPQLASEIRFHSRGAWKFCRTIFRRKPPVSSAASGRWRK